MSKKIIIIAGPNGAGKTTFARAFLPGRGAMPALYQRRSDRSRFVTLHSGRGGGKGGSLDAAGDIDMRGRRARVLRLKQRYREGDICVTFANGNEWAITSFYFFFACPPLK